MNARVMLVLCLLSLSSGCVRPGGIGHFVTHTAFFNTHHPQTYLQTQVKGTEHITGSGETSSEGGPTGTKEFTITLNSDVARRDVLLRDYQAYIQKSLTSSGLTISGQSQSGEISRFSFQYQGTGVTGYVRVSGTLDDSGERIQIEVLVYEHRS